METIAVLGGTGPQGKGLALCFARAGHRVVLGSRDADRAQATARDLWDRGAPSRLVSGASNADAAAAGSIALLAVPYDGHDELVASLAEPLTGKIVISCVNPLGFDARGPYGLPVAAGSAAERAAELLPNSHVVGAFHHLSATSLWSDDPTLKQQDVLVCGDDAAARQVVTELAAAVTGRPGVDAGALRLARQLEPLTAVLISVNKRYKAHSGLSITGLPVGA